MIASATLSARLSCDLCGSRAWAAVGAKDRRGKALRTVVCKECGLVRHRHVPTERQLDDFYTHAYRQDYHGEETPSDRRVMRAWKNGARICHLLDSHIPLSSRVLEVGAGIGCTVKNFELRGCRASGIEPHRGFHSYATNVLRADIHNEGLFEHRAARPYDAILLVHVIEHFRSPREALCRIHSLLAPRGLLYIECPNLAAPFAAPGQLFHYAHIHNFTPTTLQAMTASSGFEIVSWLSDRRDADLSLLVRRADAGPPMSIAHGYAESIESLARYNWLTYHARRSYIRDRFRKVMSYFVERVVGKSYVRHLLASISPPEAGAVRRAA